MKKIIFSAFLCSLIYIISSFRSEENIGELLSHQLDHKIYKNFDTIVFNNIFTGTLNEIVPKIKNEKAIQSFYADNGFKPVFTLKFTANGQLDSLFNYLKNSSEHGFKPSQFNLNEIEAIYLKLQSTDLIDVNESYQYLAKFEVLVADAYLSYLKYLRFGLVNPRALFSNYLIHTQQADHSFLNGLMHTTHLLDSLRKYQIQNPNYQALQNAYLQEKNDSIKRILAVNMERQRWQVPKHDKDLVQINIPSYDLTYYNGIDTIAQMKVCVGAKRENDYAQKLKIFEETGDYSLKPKNFETPMMFGTIHSFYTNPVWIIPESIASNEIYEKAIKSRYYLVKNNIKVYYKNKLVNDPTQIRWAKYKRNRLPFRFEQQPGHKNPLGKFKFAFGNANGIFLHDTDYPSAFKRSNRAISHGCIRLEQPLEFAKLLLNDLQNFDQVKMELGLNSNKEMKLHQNKQKEPNTNEKAMVAFPLKKSVPLLITYFTAWQDKGKITFAKDVYSLDEQLWQAINNLIDK